MGERTIESKTNFPPAASGMEARCRAPRTARPKGDALKKIGSDYFQLLLMVLAINALINRN